MHLIRGYEDFTKAMVEALKKIEGGCRRTVIMHSWMTEASVRQRAPFFLRWTLLAYIGPILDNMRLAEKYLESVDDIDYAFILPAGLRNSPVTGNLFLWIPLVFHKLIGIVFCHRKSLYGQGG